MKTDVLTDLLEQKKYVEFLKKVRTIITKLNDSKKQKLLVDIMDFYYVDEHFTTFRKAFDIIIGKKLNLDFCIDHWAPTFLSLVILRSPNKQLFDYFLKKGADLNFIGDTLAFEEGESLEFEKKHLLFGQYQTCLDFATIKLDDKLLVDYNYHVLKRKIDLDWREIIDDEGDIAISKREYLYLHEQSEYLYDLINTDKIIYHIKRLGSKTYDELKQSGKIHLSSQ